MERAAETLQAPFPYFGGKRRVAAEVWRRFGDVPNYIEPFFGSGAVLLGRPHAPRTETVNDKCRFVANFWRAVSAAPDEVAGWCDWPVTETDLEARHYWLVTEGAARLAQILGDPGAFDAKIAGWWCWGACCWIGGGWCAGTGPWARVDGVWVNRKSPPSGGNVRQGVRRKLPHVGDAGQGINRQLPHVGDAGQGILEWVTRLSSRLRRVRVCSGDWRRVTGDSVTIKHGVTAVFLDPPYGHGIRDKSLYRQESAVAATESAAWAMSVGEDPRYRIAFCGYAGEHQFPETWTCWAWKANGGYGSQGSGTGRSNAALERIWFSPHCLQSADPGVVQAPTEQQAGG